VALLAVERMAVMEQITEEDLTRIATELRVLLLTAYRTYRTADDSPLAPVTVQRMSAEVN